MFGLGGYLIAKFISPYINLKLHKLNKKAVLIAAIVIVAVVGGDFTYTLFNVHTGYGITEMKQEEINERINEVDNK
jgi:hypothetical protein